VITFYESDCQGQFSSLLIAFSFFPLQSAPSDLEEMGESVSGAGGQSFAWQSSSVFSIDPR
jgi:hypothetical protein